MLSARAWASWPNSSSSGPEYAHALGRPLNGRGKMTPENPGTQNAEEAHRPVDQPELRSAGSRQSVILVVDDNALFRGMVMGLVRREGYFVLSAADGQEALQLSREYSGLIDLVITDVEMPRLKGTDLCARLIEERPGIQVLLISASDLRINVGQNVNLPFLRKPFDGETLKARVRAILAASVEPPLYQLPPIGWDEPGKRLLRLPPQAANFPPDCGHEGKS
jgi:CheY-like chemotaxis protein